MKYLRRQAFCHMYINRGFCSHPYVSSYMNGIVSFVHTSSDERDRENQTIVLTQRTQHPTPDTTISRFFLSSKPLSIINSANRLSICSSRAPSKTLHLFWAIYYTTTLNRPPTKNPCIFQSCLTDMVPAKAFGLSRVSLNLPDAGAICRHSPLSLSGSRVGWSIERPIKKCPAVFRMMFGRYRSTRHFFFFLGMRFLKIDF